MSPHWRSLHCGTWFHTQTHFKYHPGLRSTCVCGQMSSMSNLGSHLIYVYGNFSIPIYCVCSYLQVWACVAVRGQPQGPAFTFCFAHCILKASWLNSFQGFSCLNLLMFYRSKLLPLALYVGSVVSYVGSGRWKSCLHTLLMGLLSRLQIQNQNTSGPKCFNRGKSAYA